jgi:hypothetical protein
MGPYTSYLLERPRFRSIILVDGLCNQCIIVSVVMTSELGNEMATKKRLTTAQKAALKAYEYALRQEDRYLGSVFVTPQGQRDVEAKTRAAYDHCKSLGMTHEHGL